MPLGRDERAAIQRWLAGDAGAPPGPVDWGAIADFAVRQAIAGLVWSAAPEGPGAGAGAEAWAALRRAALQSAARTTLALHAFARVTRTLEAAGVPCLAMKGVAIAALDPGYAVRRHLSDLDLLVRPEHVVQADAALRAAGVAPALDRPTLDGREGVEGRASLGSAVAVEVYRDPAGVPIDLHVRPPAATAARDLEGLWARARIADVAGTPVRVPSPDDQLLIACEHVFDRHGATPGLLPRHVADVARLVALGARADRTVPSVDESLRMLAEARGGGEGRRWGLPSRLERAMRPDLGRREASLRRFLKGVAVRAAIVRESGWRAVFPSRAYLAAAYKVPHDAWWVPALHLRRLLWDQPLRILRGSGKH